MADIVQCPQCQRQLRVPPDLVGQQVKCPSCSTTFIAGETGPAPPPPSLTPPTSPQEPIPFPFEDKQERESLPVPRPRRRRYEDDDDDDYDDRPRRRRRRDTVPHRGGMILTFGILSLVFFPIVFGPIAWVMGNNDMNEIRAGRMDPEGEGTTNAGRICGIIGTILGILNLCCCGLWLLAVVGGAAGN
jgi:hypothetical protein